MQNNMHSMQMQNTMHSMQNCRTTRKTTGFLCHECVIEDGTCILKVFRTRNVLLIIENGEKLKCFVDKSRSQCDKTRAL